MEDSEDNSEEHEQEHQHKLEDGDTFLPELEQAADKLMELGYGVEAVEWIAAHLREPGRLLDNLAAGGEDASKGFAKLIDQFLMEQQYAGESNQRHFHHQKGKGKGKSGKHFDKGKGKSSGKGKKGRKGHDWTKGKGKRLVEHRFPDGGDQFLQAKLRFAGTVESDGEAAD